MTLEECREIAARCTYLHDDRWEFTANGHKCHWLDPWIGLFVMEGQEGFIMTMDVAGMDIDCQNLKLTVAGL